MTAPLRITVAAATRGRPAMLRDLLRSLGEMALPQDARVTCLIVENDDAPATKDAVETLSPLPNGAGLDYVHEPRPGIPFARNRAAAEAVAAGADLLAFVDDDETVAPDWLVRLVAGYRESGAVLLGGPLRARAPQTALSPLERALLRGVSRRYRRKELRAARRAGLHGTPGVTIVTNNWLAETRLFAEHGLRFDEGMALTGGTDAKFYAEVRRRGLPTAWVADAVVSEEIPRARLSLRYQFARGRDQAATHLLRKRAERPGRAWQIALLLPLRILGLVPLMLAVPFTRGAAMADLARGAGGVAGQLGALRGRQSRLYERVTGR